MITELIIHTSRGDFYQAKKELRPYNTAVFWYNMDSKPSNGFQKWYSLKHYQEMKEPHTLHIMEKLDDPEAYQQLHPHLALDLLRPGWETWEHEWEMSHKVNDDMTITYNSGGTIKISTTFAHYTLSGDDNG